MAGAIFENAVISEMVKKDYARGIKPLFYKNLQYWLELSGQKNKGYLITNCTGNMPLPANIGNLFWKDYFS